jgi:hypothetical protein
MTDEPLGDPTHMFDFAAGVYSPAPHMASPWDPAAIHGSPAAALMAHAIESAVDDPAMTVGRITFDLLRPIPRRPLQVSAAVVREGRRIKVIDAALEHEGTLISRAAAIVLRQAEVPGALDVDFPAPSFPPPQTLPQTKLPPWRGRFAFQNCLEFREIPDPGAQFRVATWVRVPIDFMPGVPLTPLVRAAATSDFACAFSNSPGLGVRRSSNEVGFINTDISLYLHRYPVGEWLVIAVAGRSRTDAIAVGHVALYDEVGPIGRCGAVHLANPPRPAPPSK